VLTTVAAGGIGSVLALLALTVDETDEAFANIYSTAASLQNYVPRASQRLLICGVAVAATAISLPLDLTQYRQFLLLPGAFFVPLFGVLPADWLVAGRHYDPRDVFDEPAWRPGMIIRRIGGIGASLPSFAVSVVVALGVSWLARRVALQIPAHALDP
jgi:NCS1 family nucleobase:cation symporter-1